MPLSSFKRFVPACAWHRSWTCWGLSLAKSRTNKSAVPARYMTPHPPEVAPFLPISRKTSIAVFAVARQGINSTSMPLRHTKACSQQLWICARGLDAMFRGSQPSEPIPEFAAAEAPIANLDRRATLPGSVPHRESGSISDRDQHLARTPFPRCRERSLPRALDYTVAGKA